MKKILKKHFFAKRGPWFVVLFAIIGVLLLLNALAAGPFSSIEPENGTITGGAKVCADGSASGWQYVQFGKGSQIYTVPDTRNDVNPNTVIDPSGVKDSSAGLQKFINSVPAGTIGNNKIIFFPSGAKYRINSGIALNKSYQTVTTCNTLPAKLFTDSDVARPEVAYPYRIKAPAGAKQAAWQMDITHSTKNPYGAVGGRITLTTVSGSTTVTAAPGTFKVNDMWGNGITGTGIQATTTIKPSSDTVARLTLPATASGTISATLADALGASNGGYDGQVSADHKYLYTRLTTPFDASDVGESLFVFYNPYINGDTEGWTKTIRQVINDCTHIDPLCKQAVTWCVNVSSCDTDKVGVLTTGPRSNALAWATNATGAWSVQLTANPACDLGAQCSYSTSGGNAYFNAVLQAYRKNRGRIVVSINGSYVRLLHLEIEGSNVSYGRYIPNYDISEPVVTEFQHGVFVKGTENEVGWVYVHNQWADLVDPTTTNFWMHDSTLSKGGRVNMNASLPTKNIVLERNIIKEARSSLFDWEGGGNNWYWWLLNNTFGSGDFSITHATSHLKFDGNHSNQADINSGKISEGANGFTGAFLPSYFIFTNNDFSAGNADNHPFMSMKTAKTHLLIENNKARWGRGNYFVDFSGHPTNILSAGNSGLNMFGQYFPAGTVPNNGGKPFTRPGDPTDPDPWWATNAPVPPIYYRDHPN